MTALACRKYLIMLPIITCFVAVTMTNAQTTASKDTTASQAPEARPWALETRMTQLTGPFDLMIRRRLSPKTSLRLGIDISGSVSGSARDDKQEVGFDNDATRHRYGISSTIHCIRCLTPDSDLKWFIGTGPYVAYSVDRQQVDHEYSHTYSDTTYRTKQEHSIEKSSWATGIQVFTGTEWFITNRISIAVEWSLPGQYQWSCSDETTHTIRTNLDAGEVMEDSSSENQNVSGIWSFGPGSNIMILAIHF